LKGLALALGFLTRIPAPARGALGPGALAQAAAWFPVVGALVGLTLGGTRLLAGLALPAEAATVVGLIAAALVTGGLHEDGLADTVDGLGARVGRERRLEIMRDPRVGTYGALALLFVTLLAWSLLASLDGEACLRAALAGHVTARWAMLLHAAVSTHARADGLGVLLRVSPPALAIATVPTAVLTVVATGPQSAALIIAAVALATAAATAVTRRALGGSTGDTCGMVGKLAEVTAYAVVVALAL
jgi:adenosylcobinamide-GDP ribazoletransferase